jgi:hypothetical protein
MAAFAVLALKVLLFVWAAHLIWFGSHLLERFAMWILKSLPILAKQKDRPEVVSL